MNHIDHDPNVCDCDAYGNVTVKPTTYKGFTIDAGVTVKVWHGDNFVGKFATKAQAEHAIDDIIAGVTVVD